MNISIVIITRNRADTLLHCIDSISRQSGAPLEIIVVDNGSTDDTLTRVAARFPSVTLLPQPHNLGVPGGRNIGIGKASGDICLCIDDDATLLGADALHICRAYFEQQPELACLSFRIIDECGLVITRLIPRRDRRMITGDMPAALFSGTGFAVRRTAFQEVGGFWEKLYPYFGEEPDIACRFLEHGYEMLHTPRISVCHMESALERPKSRRIYCGARNTPWLALRNLPWVSVVSLTVFAWGYFGLKALQSRQLPEYLAALRASIRGMRDVYRMRRPVSARTRALLRERSGVLWY